jgi:hypothetical protein
MNKQARSYDSKRKKQYRKMLEKMYGSNENLIKEVKSNGHNIYHGTKPSNVKNISRNGLVSNKITPSGEEASKVWGKGIYFGPKQTAKTYAEKSLFGKDSVRLKTPSELKGTKALYPKGQKVMFNDRNKKTISMPAYLKDYIKTQDKSSKKQGLLISKNPKNMPKSIRRGSYYNDSLKDEYTQMHVKTNKINPELLTGAKINPYSTAEKAKIITKPVLKAGVAGLGGYALYEYLKNKNKEGGKTMIDYKDLIHKSAADMTIDYKKVSPATKKYDKLVKRYSNKYKWNAMYNKEGGKTMIDYKELIHKSAAEKNHDPFKTTKIVGITNMATIPLDMIMDTIVEGADMLRTKPKTMKTLSMFKQPENVMRLKQFGSKQLKTALPLNLAYGALLTAPILAMDYANFKKNQKMGKVAELVEGIHKIAAAIKLRADNDLVDSAVGAGIGAGAMALAKRRKAKPLSAPSKVFKILENGKLKNISFVR